MGAEVVCTAEFKGEKTTGKARLESDVLRFGGGGLRLKIPFAEISTITVRRAALILTFRGEIVSFDLGAAAAIWAEKIRHPPSRLQKLGVKSGQSVALVNLNDERLARDLEAAGAQLARRRPATGIDVIFYGA